MKKTCAGFLFTCKACGKTHFMENAEPYWGIFVRCLEGYSPQRYAKTDFEFYHGEASNVENITVQAVKEPEIEWSDLIINRQVIKYGEDCVRILRVRSEKPNVQNYSLFKTGKHDLEKKDSTTCYYLMKEGYSLPIVITRKFAKAILDDPTEGAYFVKTFKELDTAIASLEGESGTDDVELLLQVTETSRPFYLFKARKNESQNVKKQITYYIVVKGETNSLDISEMDAKKILNDPQIGVDLVEQYWPVVFCKHEDTYDYYGIDDIAP